MKALLLNTYDANGGAAIATHRIHRALIEAGVDSQMMVQRKMSGDFSVTQSRPLLHRSSLLLRPYLDKLPLSLYKSDSRKLFSSSILPDGLASQIRNINPDILHLFWLQAGFMRIETLATVNKPIVWTLHDMWPFTGGCHYDDECGRYKVGCGHCPVLGSSREKDLSHRIWSRKQQSWQGIPMTIVATSQWLAECARASSLFQHQRIEVIPNCIDSNRYKPLSRAVAREIFGLPANKKLVLVSAFSAADDPRKGFHVLMPAIRHIAQSLTDSNIELVVLGASAPAVPLDIGVKVHYISRLHDDISQVVLYSAADLLVAPSIQENLSNTVLEAMFCGRPVVAFDIGGMPDMISHMENGYLATAFDPHSLASGILWALEDDTRWQALSVQARETATVHYSTAGIAKQYADLYQDLLQ